MDILSLSPFLFLFICIIRIPNCMLTSPCSCFRTNGKYFLEEWRYSERMVMLGHCTFSMGSPPTVAIRGDGETPVRPSLIEKQFWIDKTEVIKEHFSQFVNYRDYKTTAEEYGTSFVFEPKIGQDDIGKSMMMRGHWWWTEKKFVTWRTDFHQQTKFYPVTHVSWTDATAFCEWRGGQLPSESQWEFACRGGLDNCLYPWGNSLKVNGSHMANIWQGKFPTENTINDGFEQTAPVGSFPPNGYGLFDMAGNVWEWVNDTWDNSQDAWIQKGGSFMCHRNHCFRYRCGARTKGSWDSTSSNLGFRCVHIPL